MENSFLPSIVKTNFKQLISTHFSPETDHDFYDTATAFCYEIGGFIDDETIFNCELTEIVSTPKTPENLLTTYLKYRRDISVETAIRYVLKQWVDCLRYSSVKTECISVSRAGSSATIQCLTVTERCAASITFIISREGK